MKPEFLLRWFFLSSLGFPMVSCRLSGEDGNRAGTRGASQARAGSELAIAPSEVDVFLNGEVFQWSHYLSVNADLRAAGLANEAQAREHWLTFGVAEGRSAHPRFHSRVYLQNYPDVAEAFGAGNFVAAVRHYVLYGLREGRTGAQAVAAAAQPASPPGEMRFGVFYSALDNVSSALMKQRQARGLPLYNVEQAIRSDGAIRLDQFWSGSDLSMALPLIGTRFPQVYHTRPSQGYYCIYKARPNEQGHIPDCPETESVLALQARQMVEAGIDHIVFDATNLYHFNAPGDVFQMRPLEIIFEVWQGIRDRGGKTPDIGVWHAIPPNNPELHNLVLDRLYNNPRYANLVLRDAKSNKKIFYYVDGQTFRADPAALQAIQSNRGANDVVTVPMWATTDPAELNAGKVSGLAACLNGQNQYETSVNDSAACVRHFTPASAIGSVVAVTSNFMPNYSSLPLMAPGRLQGVTLAKMFDKVLEVQPRWVLIDSWNGFATYVDESNGFAQVATSRLLGMENDPRGDHLSVDAWGMEFQRTIEPTDEYGDYHLRLASSCIRVARSGARSCNNGAELCCQARNGKPFNTIWSMVSATGTDYLWGNDFSERQALVASQRWREVCNPFPGPGVVCVNPAESLPHAGPFMLFSGSLENRRPLRRCLTQDGRTHFLSLDDACEGQKAEGVLGFISTVKTSETPRRLVRCLLPNGAHYATTFPGCRHGGREEGPLGFVK